MNEAKFIIYVLLILCLLGILLTVAADEWSGGRRWKVAVTLLVIAYAGVCCLK